MSRCLAEPYCLVKIQRKQMGTVLSASLTNSSRKDGLIGGEEEYGRRQRSMLETEMEIKDIWRRKEKTNALGTLLASIHSFWLWTK